MPSGLEIIGGPSVNQDSKVLMLIDKISHTSFPLQQTSAFYGYVTWSLTVSYTNAIYAVSQTLGNFVFCTVSGIDNGNGTTTIRVIATQAGASFDVFVFKQGGGGPIGSGVGMEMYNSDGSLGFGSNYKPLKVLMQFLYGEDASTIEEGPYAVPPDYNVIFPYKRVACIVSTHARYFDGDGTLVSGNFPYYVPRFANNQTTGECALQWWPFNSVGKDLPGWASNGRYMFIDVTNY